MKMGIDNALKEVIVAAQEHIEGGGSIGPTFYGVVSEKKGIGVFPDFKDHKHKLRLLTFIQLIFAWCEVKEYYFVFESWCKSLDEKELDKHVPGTLHLDRDRLEMLIAGSVSEEGKRAAEAYKIERTGGETSLSKTTDGFVSDFEGTFFCLLDIRNAALRDGVSLEQGRKMLETALKVGFEYFSKSLKLAVFGDWTEEQLTVFRQVGLV